jgi:hypothetical protein
MSVCGLGGLFGAIFWQKSLELTLISLQKTVLFSSKNRTIGCVFSEKLQT